MKVTVSSQDLAWPKQCAACGGPASTSAKARCTVTTGSALPGVFVYWKKRIVTVAYPICKNHAGSAAVFGRISRRSLFNLGLGYLSVMWLLMLLGYVLLSLSENEPERLRAIPVLAWAPPLAYWIVFFVAKRFTPVKLTDVTPEHATFRFSNGEYAKAFQSINR